MAFENSSPAATRLCRRRPQYLIIPTFDSLPPNHQCNNRCVAFDPQSISFYGLQHSVYVRFSLLALSSIFFLVDPFAALPNLPRHHRGRRPARAQANRPQRRSNRAHRAERVRLRRRAAIPALRHHAARLRTRRRHRPSPHRPRHAPGQTLTHAGNTRRHRSSRRKKKMPASCRSAFPCSPAPAQSPRSWCWSARRSRSGRWPRSSSPSR